MNYALFSAARNRKIPVEYSITGPDGLDLIQPLWEKLRDHHVRMSRNFTRHFAGVTFDLRKKQLLEKSRDGRLQIDLAKDPATGAIVGYCATSINKAKQGEIESIYVEQDYRGAGIGDALMTRALDWLATLAVQKTILAVAEGNESVFAFYRRHNFYSRATILERKSDDTMGKYPPA
jgi:diamine N-acetyltransferase